MSDGERRLTEHRLGDDDEADLRELRFERLEHDRAYRDAIDEAERGSRALDEVVLEFLYRGDAIRVVVGERAWTGTVIHAGAEVMTLQTPAGVHVDLVYDKVGAIRVVERSGTGGRALAGRHPGTMIARLREMVATGEVVEIGGPALPSPLEGTVTAVAETHVEFATRDKSEWVVPLGSIAYLVRQAGDEQP